MSNHPDGGYLMYGNISSDTNTILDLCAIRLNNNGDVLWSNTYSSPLRDNSYDGIVTSDGGCLLVGNYGDSVYHNYALKIDSLGSIEWSKSFSDSTSSYMSYAIETVDGFVLGGLFDKNVIIQVHSSGLSGCDYSEDLFTVSPINLTTANITQTPLKRQKSFSWTAMVLLDTELTGSSLQVV